MSATVSEKIINGLDTHWKRWNGVLTTADGLSRTAKALESGLELGGISTPAHALSKSFRAVLYVPRAFKKVRSAKEGAKGPSVGAWPSVGLRFVWFGLASMYMLRFTLFLHKQGIIDIPKRVDQLSTFATWNGIATGALGVPLSLYSMGKIQDHLANSKAGELVVDAKGNRYVREQWVQSWWINFFTVGQVGCELATTLMGLHGIKRHAYLALAMTHVPRACSFVRGWMGTDPSVRDWQKRAVISTK